jgi:hypothetical protein
LPLALLFYFFLHNFLFAVIFSLKYICLVP